MSIDYGGYNASTGFLTKLTNATNTETAPATTLRPRAGLPLNVKINCAHVLARLFARRDSATPRGTISDIVTQSNKIDVIPSGSFGSRATRADHRRPWPVRETAFPESAAPMTDINPNWDGAH